MDRESRKKLEIIARKADIIEAAAKLFSEKDFHEVSMDKIAEEVGLSKGTLYLYFKNKESLFFSIIKERTNILFQRLETVISSGEPFQERLEKLVASYLGFFQENESFFKIVHSEKSRVILQNRSRLRKHVLQSFKDYILILKHFIEEGQKEGVLRQYPSLAFTKALRGLMDAFTFHWIFIGSNGSLTRETAHIVDLFLHGAGKISDRNGGIFNE